MAKLILPDLLHGSSVDGGGDDVVVIGVVDGANIGLDLSDVAVGVMIGTKVGITGSPV